MLLPGAPAEAPELPLFLQGHSWVRFEALDDDGALEDDALWRLECGIVGRAPGRGRPAPAAVAAPPPEDVAVGQVFIDTGIPWGAAWAKQIREALERADHGCVALSLFRALTLSALRRGRVRATPAGWSRFCWNGSRG